VFDDIVMVDWSANKTPNLGANSIWICHLDAANAQGPAFVLANPSTRAEAQQLIEQKAVRAFERSRKILVGFDFNFGFPSVNGFGAMGAAALAIGGPKGATRYDIVWDWFTTTVKDSQGTNPPSNNRFEVAGEFNGLLTRGGWDELGGAFFVTDERNLVSGLKRVRPGINRSLRTTEKAASRRPKSVWQLDGRGAVGSQTVMGLPALFGIRNLCARLGITCEVWPFDTSFAAPSDEAQVVVVEIYPSLFDVAAIFSQWFGTSLTATLHSDCAARSLTIPMAGLPGDARQVAVCAAEVLTAQRDPAGTLTQWFDPRSARGLGEVVEHEEGWIFGVL
jgi:hypothetical protein